MTHTSASYSFTVRVRLSQDPGTFASVAQAIAQAGGSIGAVDIVRSTPEWIRRDITAEASGSNWQELRSRTCLTGRS
jgi:malate dehydrogenase (oxaloacetate-decarboxylating)